MRFLVGLIAVVLGGLVAAAQEAPLRTIQKVVVSEQRALIIAYFQLNPDCSPVGNLTVRIKKQPESGKLEYAPGQGFPSFPPEHPRNKCNDKMNDGMLFHYTSNTGFIGTDQVEIEIITSNGFSFPARIRITVK